MVSLLLLATIVRVADRSEFMLFLLRRRWPWVADGPQSPKAVLNMSLSSGETPRSPAELG